MANEKRLPIKALRTELRRAEMELALAEARHTARLISSFDESSDPLSVAPRPDSDSGWALVSSGGAIAVGAKSEASLPDLARTRRESYQAWRLNSHARGALRNFVKFIIGREFGLDFDDQQRGTVDEDSGKVVLATDADNEAPILVREIWSEFERTNKFRGRAKELVLRTLRDGECFIRRFTDPNDGRVRVRFIEPARIAGNATTVGAGTATVVRETDVEPEDREQRDDGYLPRSRRGEKTKISDGIEHIAEDVETIVAYWIAPAVDGGQWERVPARDIYHAKCLADANDLRGFPLLEVVLKKLTNYEQWEHYRLVLNKARTAIVLIRKVDASHSQASAIVAGRASGRSAPQGREPVTTSGRREAMFREGTILTPGPGVDYRYESPNLDAKDAGEDGRRFLLTIAAGLSLPEMLVTGDWSNANFASSTEARTPAVREWEDWQDFFEDAFVQIVRWVLRPAIRMRGLPAETKLGVKIHWPILVTKDAAKDTERYEKLSLNKVMSKTTWGAREDLNYEEEVENMRMEAEMAGEDGADLAADPGAQPDDQTPADQVAEARTLALVALGQLDESAGKHEDAGVRSAVAQYVEAARPFIDALAEAAKRRTGASMTIQTLIFDKDAFGSAADARKWARDHGFSAAKVDETGESYRLRQRDPGRFRDKSLRTITLKKGVKAVVGKPKGKAA